MMAARYDLSHARELASGDKQFLQQLIGLGIKEIREDLTCFEMAAAKNDEKQMRFHLHKLCSSTRMFGLRGAEELKSFHTNFRHMKSPTWQERADEVIATLEQAMSELEKDHL